MGGDPDGAAKGLAFPWMLSRADSKYSLLDIAERANLALGVALEAARALQDQSFIVEDVRRPRRLPGARNVRPNGEWPEPAAERRFIVKERVVVRFGDKSLPR